MHFLSDVYRVEVFDAVAAGETLVINWFCSQQPDAV
jgi:hypothetical protein